MADYCLPPKLADAFKAALLDGRISPARLNAMSSAERRELFKDIIGSEHAQEVNTLYERTLLLQDQQRGMMRWADKLQNVSPSVRKDIFDKIQTLDRVLNPADERAFLADLAAKKLGMSVTADEAKAISQGAKAINDLKAEWNPKTQTWTSDTARLQYGAAYVKYQEYVGELLRDANTPTFREWIKDPKAIAISLAASAKGIVASLDNSFFGRQGIKMLFTHPDIWGSAFANSWADIGRTLKGEEPIAALKADIFSRPNAMNGKYRNAKIAVNIAMEEAFPTTLPEKIPLFGRLYKASEAAFSGAALRMRADLADRIIPRAEAFGVNMSKPGGQAEGIGHLINAMTGRGNVGNIKGEAVNATFFSLRFLKSNYDTLTMHSGGFGIEAGPARAFVRREAATNLAKIAGGMAAVLFTANQLWPGSVETDPRSSDYGKIKIGDTRFDISGGMASMITLASRLVPTEHNGKWSFWYKSTVTGKYTDLLAGKYGQKNALDMLEDFWEGKLSPLAGIPRDVWQGKTFGGQPVTVLGELGSLVTPIGVQTFMETMNDKNAAPVLATMILDSLGVSANTRASNESKRDIWGFETGKGPGPDDPLNKTLERLGIDINQPPKKIRSVELSPELYDEFQQKHGELLRKAVGRAIQTPNFERLPIGRQEEIVRQRMKFVGKAATDYMISHHPIEIAKPAHDLKQKQLLEGSAAAVRRRAETVH